jgi:hypothetical protein
VASAQQTASSAALGATTRTRALIAHALLAGGQATKSVSVMSMGIARRLVYSAFALGVHAGMGCGSDSDDGLGMGKCLSDADICQFELGVSTRDNVQKKLGNAQQYLGSDTWIFTCQQVNGTQIVHNDFVVFSFDAMGVLEDVSVARQGSAATPPPDCLDP